MKPCNWILVLSLASSSAFRQTSPGDIRVTGVHPMTRADTPDSAKQLALLEAEQKTLAEAVARLRDLPELKAFQLKPGQLEAYAAALIDIQELSTRTSSAGSQTVYHAEILLRLDASETLRRLGRLRKDQEASSSLVDTWKQMQDLHRQLSDQTERAGLTPDDVSKAAAERQRTLTALRVKHLIAQATAALARTEERPVGGRAPSAEGRERAKRLVEAALALAPESPDAHAGMGDVLADAGQLQAAEAEYREALLGNRDSSAGHIKLANALILQQKFPEGVAELREALRLAPGSVRAHSDLGWVLGAQQNVADAIVEYKEALRLDPDYVEAHNGLAIILARQGQVPEAVAEFREMVRVDPDSAIGYYNLAYALADIDKDAESAAALREVIRINPNHYNARYNLGELFRLEGKFDEAATQFREYVRLAPDTPQNGRNIGRANDFIKKFENP